MGTRGTSASEARKRQIITPGFPVLIPNAAGEKREREQNPKPGQSARNGGVKGTPEAAQEREQVPACTQSAKEEEGDTPRDASWQTRVTRNNEPPSTTRREGTSVGQRENKGTAHPQQNMRRHSNHLEPQGMPS